MTRYYFYITAGDQIDTTSKLFLVAVGSGQQAKRDFDYLTDYAAQHGHFFAIRSLETSTFVHRIIDCFSDSTLRVQLIKARDLVRSFKTATCVPLVPHVLINGHQQAIFLNSEYRYSSLFARHQNGG